MNTWNHCKHDISLGESSGQSVIVGQCSGLVDETMRHSMHEHEPDGTYDHLCRVPESHVFHFKNHRRSELPKILNQSHHVIVIVLNNADMSEMTSLRSIILPPAWLRLLFILPRVGSAAQGEKVGDGEKAAEGEKAAQGEKADEGKKTDEGKKADDGGKSAEKEKDGELRFSAG